MTEMLAIIKNSGFSDLFLFACISFFLAKFVLGQDWYKQHLNELRNTIGWTFYVFGALLLLVTLFTLPQCSRVQNQQAEQKKELSPPSVNTPENPSGDSKK